jgi:hypothetical protein
VVFGKITSSFVTANRLADAWPLSIALARVKVDYLVLDGRQSPQPEPPTRWSVTYEPQGQSWVMTVTKASGKDLGSLDTPFGNAKPRPQKPCLATPTDVASAPDGGAAPATLAANANLTCVIRRWLGVHRVVSALQRRTGTAGELRQQEEWLSRWLRELLPAKSSTLNGFYPDIFGTYRQQSTLPARYLSEELNAAKWRTTLREPWPALECGGGLAGGMASKADAENLWRAWARTSGQRR